MSMRVAEGTRGI